RFLFPVPPPVVTYTLPLHDALPISPDLGGGLVEGDDVTALGRGESCLEPGGPRSDDGDLAGAALDHGLQHELRLVPGPGVDQARSEEHTSELQSRFDLVCRLLLEKR